MAPVSVIYESPSRRRYFRVLSPAEVIIDGAKFRTKDWSAGGFAIVYPGDPGEGQGCRSLQAGDKVRVSFAVDFQGFAISFCAVAAVVRVEEQLLAAMFFDLGDRECSLLRHFSSSLLSGKLASIEGVLKNIDRPVTKLTPENEKAVKPPRSVFTRIAIAAVYLILGIAAGGFAVIAILTRINQVNIETAVTSVPLEQVVSADVGRIAEMNGKPGQEMKAGDALFRIDNEITARSVDAARAELETARIALREAQSHREQEENKRGLYQSISANQLEVANANIKSLTAERDEARLEYDRYNTLAKEGVISRQLRDSKKAALDEREADLERAIAEQKIAVTSARNTDAGYFFSGNFLVGDLAAAEAAEAAARDHVRVVEQDLAKAVRIDSKRLYRAPFDGVVLRVFKSAGMTVDRGEALMVLRRKGESSYIDAYLTQDEVSELAVGARGVAEIAATGKRYPIRIALLDRTTGFLKEMQTPKLQQPQFAARTNAERSAYAKIEFVSLSEPERASIAPGLPVFVSIPRRRRLGFSILRTVQAASADDQKSNAPRLWPADSPLITKRHIGVPRYEEVRRRVLAAADAALEIPAAPVETLKSAGATDQSSPEFQQSRRAFLDSDNFALLALAYKLTENRKYMESAGRIINEWSRVNRPTGNPIDETRIDGFLWGLDLLPETRNASVTAWLERWYIANGNWKFGSLTTTNNHKTHHLKIRLMLERLLGKNEEYRIDLAATEQQMKANLPTRDGKSIDYDQRDAMHYHVFDLEAWIEIELITGCCRDSVDQAFAFFEKALAEDPNHIEFAGSSAPIDRKRAAGGFQYAQPRRFDPRKAARVIFSYATLSGRTVDPELWKTAIGSEQPSTLLYEARWFLWKSRP